MPLHSCFYGSFISLLFTSYGGSIAFLCGLLCLAILGNIFLEFFMEWFLAIPWLYFEHHSQILIGVYWASTSMGFLPLLWPLLVIYFAHSLSNHVASYGILFKGFILTFLLATKTHWRDIILQLFLVYYVAMYWLLVPLHRLPSLWCLLLAYLHSMRRFFMAYFDTTSCCK